LQERGPNGVPNHPFCSGITAAAVFCIGFFQVLSAADKAAIIEHINIYRRQHSAPDVVWNSGLVSSIAQPWANYLATNVGIQMQHTSSTSTPPRNGAVAGENLAWFSGYSQSGTDWIVDIVKKSVDLWYDEVTCMDWSNPEPTSYGGGAHTCVVGHFTCLVWVDQDSTGLAMSYNTANVETNVNQNVALGCNMIGDFAANVHPFTAVPEPEPTLLEAAAAAATGSAAGIIVTTIVLLLLVLLLIWLQYPFIKATMEAYPPEDKPFQKDETTTETKDKDETGKSAHQAQEHVHVHPTLGGSEEPVDKTLPPVPPVHAKKTKKKGEYGVAVTSEQAADLGDVEAGMETEESVPSKSNHWYWSRKNSGAEYSCGQWLSIWCMSVKACTFFYARALLGGETACCKVLHASPTDTETDAVTQQPTDKIDKKDGDQNPEDAGAAEAADNQKPCYAPILSCCALWNKAGSACLAECWVEANEELDHHEERKEGQSWYSRTFKSGKSCLRFYGKCFVQTIRDLTFGCVKHCTLYWTIPKAETVETAEDGGKEAQAAGDVKQSADLAKTENKAVPI